jgi:hypothetical protein
VARLRDLGKPYTKEAAMAGRVQYRLAARLIRET